MTLDELIERLQTMADEHGGEIHVEWRSGELVSDTEVILAVAGGEPIVVIDADR